MSYFWRLDCATPVPMKRRKPPPRINEVEIVLVDENVLREAEAYLSGCEHCAEFVAISFDYLLDAITHCNPLITEYVMCRPAKCPRCSRNITETTLVIT